MKKAKEIIAHLGLLFYFCFIISLKFAEKMKKHFILYLLFFSSLPSFAQYFRKGDVQIGYKIARQRQWGVFNKDYSYAAYTRQMLSAEYHVIKNVTLYGAYGIPLKSSFYNVVENVDIDFLPNTWSIGGRCFTPGLFRGYLYFYGDLSYGKSKASVIKLDKNSGVEVAKINENIQFSGFTGGICIKPLKYFSIDINLIRIGVLKTMINQNSPFEQNQIINFSGFWLRTPLFSSDYNPAIIGVNFIFSTQKNKKDE